MEIEFPTKIDSLLFSSLVVIADHGQLDLRFIEYDYYWAMGPQFTYFAGKCAHGTML